MSAEAVVRRIGLSEPSLAGSELEYLRQCIESGWISSAGPFVTRFEQAVGERLEASHAVATASGTAALHLALLACGVGANDEVCLPSITFIAPANAVRYVGAHPLFFDIDPQTLQLDVEGLAAFLEGETDAAEIGRINRRTGRSIKALMPVHLLGHPVDMDPILELGVRFDLKVIEDASEAMGTRYRGRSVGALGTVGCMSFNGNKTITCGGGGMLVTQDSAIASQARHLSTQARLPGDEFIHDQVGYNYRLTSLQAAVGLAQLERLDEILDHKRATHLFYRDAFADRTELEIPAAASWAQPNYWLSFLRMPTTPEGLTVRGIRAQLAGVGIETRPLWQPLHLSPAMGGKSSGDFPEAEAAYEECLCLPSSPSLKPSDLERVVMAVREVLEAVAHV